MNLEPEDDAVPASAVIGGDAEAARERIAERIHFLFRQAGDNPPALELKQQIMTYRLLGMLQ